MKQLFIGFLLLFVSLQSNGQLIHSYKDIIDNKEAFSIYYGSVAAYNFEEEMMLNSNHHCMVALIGAKFPWLKQLTLFCVHNLKCSPRIDVDDDQITTEYDVYPGITMGDEDTSALVLRITKMDDEARIKEVKITGNTELLIRLYCEYWYTSDIHLKALKKGIVLYQNHASDRITFNWKGSKPYLLVSLNPTFAKSIVPQ